MLSPFGGGFAMLLREELIKAGVVGKAAQDGYGFGGVGGGLQEPFGVSYTKRIHIVEGCTTVRSFEDVYEVIFAEIELFG